MLTLKMFGKNCHTAIEQACGCLHRIYHIRFYVNPQSSYNHRHCTQPGLETAQTRVLSVLRLKFAKIKIDHGHCMHNLKLRTRSDANVHAAMLECTCGCKTLCAGFIYGDFSPIMMQSPYKVHQNHQNQRCY